MGLRHELGIPEVSKNFGPTTMLLALAAIACAAAVHIGVGNLFSRPARSWVEAAAYAPTAVVLLYTWGAAHMSTMDIEEPCAPPSASWAASPRRGRPGRPYEISPLRAGDLMAASCLTSGSVRRWR